MLSIIFNLIIFIYLKHEVNCTSKFNTFHISPGYQVKEINDVIINLKYLKEIKYQCILRCLLQKNCKSISSSNLDSICKLHMVPIFPINFLGDVLSKSNWDLFFTNPEMAWIPIAKFSASNGQFKGDYSYELWNNPTSSLNNDSCASTNESTRCSRHFVHKSKNWLLGLDKITKVKVSLYESGFEAAWVIFDKQPGSNDNWFQPSRVIDSYPWDTKLLKSLSEMSMEPQQYNEATRFYIMESNSDFNLRKLSPHRYWMKVHETSSLGSTDVNQCEYGIVTVPYILYSKDRNPTLLSKSGVSHVIDWSTPTGGRYTLTWSDAQNFCEIHLNTSLASYNEVNNVRINQPYQCCMVGWMAGQKVSYPMNERKGGCGNFIGMKAVRTTGRWNVYCRPDQNLVGVADTMVISINM